MGFYYEIKETNDERIICYKKAAWFYIFMWPIVFFAGIQFLFGFRFTITTLLALVFFILMMIFAVPFWKLNSEIKKAMKKGNVRVKGSKYSFSNPLTYIISKKRE